MVVLDHLPREKTDPERLAQPDVAGRVVSKASRALQSLVQQSHARQEVGAHVVGEDHEDVGPRAAGTARRFAAAAGAAPRARRSRPGPRRLQPGTSAARSLHSFTRGHPAHGFSYGVRRSDSTRRQGRFARETNPSLRSHRVGDIASDRPFTSNMHGWRRHPGAHAVGPGVPRQRDGRRGHPARRNESSRSCGPTHPGRTATRRCGAVTG